MVTWSPTSQLCPICAWASSAQSLPTLVVVPSSVPLWIDKFTDDIAITEDGMGDVSVFEFQVLGLNAIVVNGKILQSEPIVV